MKKLWFRVIFQIQRRVNDIFRIHINRENRKKLKNKDITLISSNCNGCLILHDLGLRYNSPFVNMYLEPSDFIRLLQNFSHYMSMELEFIDDKNHDYPVACLGDVVLYCVHYKSSDEVVKKWNDRKKRMNMSNCYILFNDRDGCTQEHLRAFDTLPYEYKVVFTNRPYDHIQSAFYIKGFEEQECVGDLYKYGGWRGVKYYDAFDYVNWFNEGTWKK